MGIRTVSLSDDQNKYFIDVDNSIVHHSVELGKLELQTEALRGALKSLYASRMKSLGAAVEAAGLDPSACLGARIESGQLVIQVPDVPADS